MNKRLAETIALSIVLLLGAAYLYSAVTMGDTAANSSLPPGYFPTLVGALLVLLTLRALYNSIRHIKDCKEKLVINRGSYFLLTIMAMVIYLCLWEFFGLFYPGTFLLLFFLITLYGAAEKRKNRKQIILNVTVSAFVTLLVYLLFGLLLHVRF